MNECDLSISWLCIIIIFFFLQSCVAMEQKELMEELVESMGATAR